MNVNSINQSPSFKGVYVRPNLVEEWEKLGMDGFHEIHSNVFSNEWETAKTKIDLYLSSKSACMKNSEHDCYFTNISHLENMPVCLTNRHAEKFNSINNMKERVAFLIDSLKSKFRFDVKDIQIFYDKSL